MTAGRCAAFLDRDGVLIEEVHHLTRPEQVRLLPGAGAAVQSLRSAGYLAIVITNQSAVARGLCSETDLAEVHRELQAQLEAEGTRYDDLFYCPHHPLEGVGPYRIDCDCRKPAPGMLLAARDRHGLDLMQCWVVGDKASDIEAANRAGCRALLVRTGHGGCEATLGPPPRPEAVLDDLPAAAQWVLSRGHRRE